MASSSLRAGGAHQRLGNWNDYLTVELRQYQDIRPSLVSANRLQVSDARQRRTVYFLKPPVTPSSSSSSLPPHAVDERPSVAPPAASDSASIRLDGDGVSVEVRVRRLAFSEQRCKLCVYSGAAAAGEPLLVLNNDDMASASGDNDDDDVTFVAELRVDAAALPSLQLCLTLAPLDVERALPSSCAQLTVNVGGDLAAPLSAASLPEQSSEPSMSAWQRQLLCSASGVYVQLERSVQLHSKPLNLRASLALSLKAAATVQPLLASGGASGGSETTPDSAEVQRARMLSRVRWLYPRLEEPSGGDGGRYQPVRNKQLKLTAEERQEFAKYPMRRLFRVQWRGIFSGSSQYRVVVYAPATPKAAATVVPLAHGLTYAAATQLLLACVQLTYMFTSEYDLYGAVKAGFDFCAAAAASSQPATVDASSITTGAAVQRNGAELLQLAQRANYEALDGMPLVYRSGLDRDERATFVVQLPAIDRQAQLLHLLRALHGSSAVERPYTLLVCLLDVPASLRPSSFELLDVYRLLPRPLRKHCELVVLLDPPVWARKLVVGFRTVCRRYASRLVIVSRPDELAAIIDASQLHLPSRYSRSAVHTSPLGAFGTAPPRDCVAPVVAELLRALDALPGVLAVEGLFRISASLLTVQTLIAQLNTASHADDVAAVLSPVKDAHVLTALLKKYLVELPESLITRSAFLTLSELDADESGWSSRAVATLAELPAANVLTLNAVFEFVHRVELCEENRMQRTGLAIVLGPSLCSIAAADIFELKASADLVEQLLAHYADVFPLPVRPASAPHTDLQLPVVAAATSAPTNKEKWQVLPLGSGLVALASLHDRKFLRADKRSAVVNAASARAKWERWRVFELGNDQVSIQSDHGTWLAMAADGRPRQVTLSSDSLTPPSFHRVVVHDADPPVVAFRSASGGYLSFGK